MQQKLVDWYSHFLYYLLIKILTSVRKKIHPKKWTRKEITLKRICLWNLDSYQFIEKRFIKQNCQSIQDTFEFFLGNFVKYQSFQYNFIYNSLYLINWWIGHNHANNALSNVFGKWNSIPSFMMLTNEFVSHAVLSQTIEWKTYRKNHN